MSNIVLCSIPKVVVAFFLRSMPVFSFFGSEIITTSFYTLSGSISLASAHIRLAFWIHWVSFGFSSCFFWVFCFAYGQGYPSPSLTEKGSDCPPPTQLRSLSICPAVAVCSHLEYLSLIGSQC